ncbi:MAG: hypothetical protein ACI9MR_002383 [Myxococcota bacterium]|jgi:hypothetical protein
MNDPVEPLRPSRLERMARGRSSTLADGAPVVAPIKRQRVFILLFMRANGLFFTVWRDYGNTIGREVGVSVLLVALGVYLCSGYHLH